LRSSKVSRLGTMPPRGMCLFLLGMATTIAAPAKKSVRKPAVAPVEKETVYVAAPAPTPKPEPVAPKPSLPIRVDISNSKTDNRPIPLQRDGIYAFGGALGLYQAEVLGANPFAQGYVDWFPLDAPVFFQFTVGVGTVQSGFSEEIVGADVFDHSWMVAFEALGAYGFDLSKRAGNGASRGLYPYFVGGITAIWQGGVPNFGGVIGYGHRLPVPFMTRNPHWALAFMVKEHIYSQKIRTEPSISQNVVVTWGLQRFF
jgi:hypothetical protein